MSLLGPQWRNISFLKMEARLLEQKIKEDEPRGDIQHLVNISGGKDSDAVYLLALELGIPFTSVFADTGHEHIWTYEHVALLAGRTGGPEVQWIRADFTEAFAQRRREYPGKVAPAPQKLPRWCQTGGY